MHENILMIVSSTTKILAHRSMKTMIILISGNSKDLHILSPIWYLHIALDGNIKIIYNVRDKTQP